MVFIFAAISDQALLWADRVMPLEFGLLVRET